MTFQEKVDALKQDRTNTISAIRGINSSEVDLQESIDFNNQYLFGDGTHLGVVNFLELYYSELNLAVGRIATTPALHNGLDSTKNSWTSQFNSAVTTAGDGSLYLDGNSDGIADENINNSSAWLFQNGDQGQTNAGIKSEISSINSALGASASNNSDSRISDYIYTSGDGTGLDDTVDALLAAQTRAQSDRGSGLLGKRTQNADENSEFVVEPDPLTGTQEIYTEEDPSDPGFWRYTVGYNGADTPHYFAEPERSNLINALDSIIIELQSYEAKIIEIEGYITSVDNGTNALFSEAGMDNDIDTATELINLGNLKTQIQSLITDYQSQSSYFSVFTASTDISGQVGYIEADFNNRLNTTISGLNSTLTSELNSRVTEVESFINLSDATLTLGFRKWLYFWVKENIQKPVSPYISLNGIGVAKTSQQNSLSNQNATLNTVSGNAEEYLVNAPMIGAFPNPKLDENGIILQQRVNLLWLGYPAANKYKIFRSPRSSIVSITNDNWTDATLLSWIITVNEDSGSIDIEYLDTTFLANTLYIYRVQAFDSTGDGPSSPLPRIDSFDSSSLQSKIYDEANGVALTDITSGRMTVPEGHEFQSGSWVYIVADDFSVEEFYLVSAVTEDTVILENTSLNLGASTIYRTFGVIQTPA